MAEEEEDLENTAGDGDGEGEEAPVKGKKKLLIIIVVLLLLIGGGAGAYFAGLFGGQEKGEHHEEAADEHAEDSHGEHGEDEHGEAAGDKSVVYYDLPEFLVNLNTNGKTVNFLKMTVTLELPSQATVTEIESKMPRIVDSFQVYLRELRTSDLSGSAGIYRLRQELLLRINKSIHPAKVNDILFKQMIVQ